MSKEAILDVIVVDDFKTKFMQAVDLFDSGKIVGEVQTYTVSFKEGELVDFSRCQQLIDKLEESKKFSFIHLRSIQDDDTLLLNKKLSCKPYIDYAVRQVSDGRHSFFMKDFLSRVLHTEVETDKFMFVKKIVE